MIRKEIDLSKFPDDTNVWVCPFNDIHYNTEECDKERFHRYIKWGVGRMKKGEKLVGIGLGDYNDILSPSERASLVAAKGGYGLHETSLVQIDKWIEEMTLKFAKSMEPWWSKGGVEMMLEGHHYMCYSMMARNRGIRGKSNTEHLCKLMGATYGGQLGIVDLNFGGGLHLVVVATHGYGGARTPGARVIKRVRMNEVYEGDLYLMAHDNTKMAISDNVLKHIGGKYVARKRTYCGVGSFQRAYPDNEPSGGYVEAIMLPPSDLGAVVTHVKREKRDGKYRLDWHTSV
jgi:hypothetical protein